MPHLPFLLNRINKHRVVHILYVHEIALVTRRLPPYLQAICAPLGSRKAHGSRKAFTLIELLVVVGVIALMTAAAVPAFNALRGGADFTSQVYEIAGLFDQARSYATANNTYVLAGIKEVSAAYDTSVNPQVSGTGRIAVALIASNSGTRPYNPNSLVSWRAAY